MCPVIKPLVSLTAGLRHRVGTTYQETPEHERDGSGGGDGSLPATLGSRTHKVGHCVGNSFENDDAAEPSMEQVECVEGDAENVDQRIVARGHEEEGDHVGHGENACAVAEGPAGLIKGLGPGNVDDREDGVEGEVRDEEDELQARGQCADVDGAAELELAVVALAEFRMRAREWASS